MTVQPLAGVRVLELGDDLAAAYTGRLLADLGADVVKVEPATGDPLRHRGPYVGGVADPERSAGFAYFCAAKRSVVADAATIAALAGAADVVVQSTVGGERWLSDAALAAAEAANPGLISASISTFGGDGPTSDLLALAAGGLLSVNATDPDVARGTPLRYRGEFSSIHAACDATLAVLGALHARLADGRGQRIDVSAQAATAGILATAMAIWLYTGQLPAKDGVRSVVPWGFFECADGFVLIQVTEDAQWFNLRRIIGEPEWAQPDVFDTTAMRSQLQDVVHSMLAAELTRFTVEEFLDACQREGVAAARVQTAADLLAWPHLRARDYFAPIELAGAPGVSFEAPTPPPLPDEEAPVKRSVSCGLRAGGKGSSGLGPPSANSWVASLPRQTAAPASNRSTAPASREAGCGGPRCELQLVLSPATSKTSLTA